MTTWLITVKPTSPPSESCYATVHCIVNSLEDRDHDKVIPWEVDLRQI
jgi:hypothetical protein